LKNPTRKEVNRRILIAIDNLVRIKNPTRKEANRKIKKRN